MAIFELEIGDDDVQRVFNAVSQNYHRPDWVANPEYIFTTNENGEEVAPVDENGNPMPKMIENPETKGDFTHRKVREFLADHVKAWETKQAKVAALSSIDTSIAVNDPNP